MLICFDMLYLFDKYLHTGPGWMQDVIRNLHDHTYLSFFATTTIDMLEYVV